jgi:iron-sulfur cluster repair protein YtfE (RIC family)
VAITGTEQRLLAAAHTNKAVRTVFSRYEQQMEGELQSLVRFVQRQDPAHALPRTPGAAARLLDTLRAELDRAEHARRAEAESAAVEAQRSLAATVRRRTARM